MYDALATTYIQTCCHQCMLVACGMQIWGTASVLRFFNSNEPWRTYLGNGNFLLQQITPGSDVQLSANVTVTPASVPHRAEFSDAVGYYVKVGSNSEFDRLQTPSNCMCDVMKGRLWRFGCACAAMPEPARLAVLVPHMYSNQCCML